MHIPEDHEAIGVLLGSRIAAVYGYFRLCPVEAQRVQSLRRLALDTLLSFTLLEENLPRKNSFSIGTMLAGPTWSKPAPKISRKGGVVIEFTSWGKELPNTSLLSKLPSSKKYEPRPLNTSDHVASPPTMSAKVGPQKH